MELIRPSEAVLNSYLESREECLRQGLASFFSSDVADGDLLLRFENLRVGIGLPEGWVPESHFWLVEGNFFIGRISVRHRLTDALLRFGGHIGYYVRPSCWRQGYGSRMLGLVLPEAKKLGIGKALITCDDTNIASARLIEKNGGILENIIENVFEGKPRLTRRYWISLEGTE